VKHLSVIVALSGAAACARPQPQVMTPVRIDTTSSTTPASSAANGHTPAARSAPMRGYRTVADDPFAGPDDFIDPAPNRMRGADGRPGPDYWQQRADYAIAASLDTAARSVSGTVSIKYTNNSPDTLRWVWLQMDQNLYRSGSKGSTLYPADSRWGVRGFEGGYDLRHLTVNGRPAEGKVDDTMMRIDLETPIAPKGGVATIAMEFAFRVPEHGSDRMGRDGTLYEIAQWYPRMAVYDDVRGWNTDPYLGQGEFYLEYGNIDYSVTAPAGYTIAGSGVLQNGGEVLSAEQRARLARAAKAEQVVPIITRDEAQALATAGTKTWRFRAENVRDVAWAGAPDFRWDATSWNGILTQAYYQFAKTGKAWEQAAEQTQWSIRTYSQLFLPYPYPQATSVAGPVGGMEYPMFVMVGYGSNNDPTTIFGTIDHEHGHEWFPMIVGSNERRYAWQDEGFNTYINAFSNERRYPATSAWAGYVQNWRNATDAGIASPLMTPPDRINPSALGAIGYRKPGAVMLALRDHVVGQEALDRAFREYARRWAFKHPTPGDFFRTVENVTGQDLAWYWRAFWYTDDVLDIAIDSVSMREEDGQPLAVVAMHRNTSIPFPVELRLRFVDGSTQDTRIPVEIWSKGEHVDATIAVKGPVTGARLWPDPSVPDWNAANDAWGNAPAADPPGPVTFGGLSAPPLKP
jgi:peptidase M1-like protein